MTSLEEVRAVLAVAAVALDSARGYTEAAAAGLTEAVTILTELGSRHSEPLVPPSLLRAVAELDRGRGLIAAGADAMSAVGARL